MIGEASLPMSATFKEDSVTETLAERVLADGSRPKTLVSGGRTLLSRRSVHYVRNSFSSYR